MAMHNWFECKVFYEKMLENGTQKKVTEPYLVDALSLRRRKLASPRRSAPSSRVSSR